MTTLPSQTENFGIYNPPVFVSRDPLFEKYFWMSPYAYCANNPMKYVDPTGCDILPSKSFNESKYGNVYENLRSIGVYNKLVKPFERENIDLELQVSGTLNSDELGKTDRCSPVIQRDENDKIVGMCVKTDFGKEQSEIGCVKTLLHEAVHANRKFNEREDPQSHTGFDRHSVLKGLKKYNRKFMDSKYSNQQLKIISWGGLSESKEYQNYINNKYKKKDEIYQQAENRFIKELRSLIYDNN